MNNPTIDGVSREDQRHAAVKALHDVMQSVPSASLYSLAEAVLDAGYAPPCTTCGGSGAVFQLGFMSLDDGNDEPCPDCAPAVERWPVCEVVMIDPFVLSTGNLHLLKKGDKLYGAPPEVTALQSRINQLEAEAMYAAATYQAARARIEDLESGRGEPVAWMHTEIPGMCIAAEVKAHNLKIGGAPAKGVEGYNVPLYAAQTAPVAVVLPKYTCVGKGGEYELLGSAVGAGTLKEMSPIPVYRDTATGQLFVRTPLDFSTRMACLDATAALNRRDTPTFELADADGYA